MARDITIYYIFHHGQAQYTPRELRIKQELSGYEILSPTFESPMKCMHFINGTELHHLIYNCLTIPPNNTMHTLQ